MDHMAGIGKPRSRRRDPVKREKNVIWSKERSRTAGKSSTKNSWQATFTVKRDLAYDVDVRPLVAHVSVGLAEFFREQVRQGKRANGFGALRKVNARTKALSDSGRITDKMLGRSGYGADHWWLGKLRGDGIKAQRMIKPYGGPDGPEPRVKSPGRDLLLNVLLQKGVDFQSVRGGARKEIDRLFNEYLKTCMGEDPGNGPVDAGEVLLPEATDPVE